MYLLLMLMPPEVDLLYECSSLKVLNGLFTELCLDVVSAEPLDDFDVGWKVSVGLDDHKTQHQSVQRLKIRLKSISRTS